MTKQPLQIEVQHTSYKDELRLRENYPLFW